MRQKKIKHCTHKIYEISVLYLVSRFYVCAVLAIVIVLKISYEILLTWSWGNWHVVEVLIFSEIKHQDWRNILNLCDANKYDLFSCFSVYLILIVVVVIVNSLLLLLWFYCQFRYKNDAIVCKILLFRWIETNMQRRISSSFILFLP